MLGMFMRNGDERSEGKGARGFVVIGFTIVIVIGVDGDGGW